MATVIKLGGNVCGDQEVIDQLVAAWQARTDGLWVVVHGAGPQLDKALAASGPVQRVQGLRVTPPEAASTMRTVLDRVGSELAGELRQAGAEVVHVPSNWALLHATKKQVDGHDIGRVGTPVMFDAEALRAMVPDGCLVVIGPMGWDADGPLNVNADEAACSMAKSLRVDRLVLATDVPHVLGPEGPIVRLVPTDVAGLIVAGTAQGGMVPKLLAAADAVTSGIGEVVVGSLSAAWDGSGTRVSMAA